MTGSGQKRNEKERSMDTKEAILDFQYSEKMKSGLIIGTHLLDQLVSLKNDEFSDRVIMWIWREN
jgi:hypothetical protein